MSRESIFAKIGLPKEFGVVILVFFFILTLAPYFAGQDFGIFKIPIFSGNLIKKLKIIAPPLFILTIILFIPFVAKEEQKNRPAIKLPAKQEDTEKIPDSNSEKELSKDDVRNLARNYGLFRETHTNPHLRFQEGDISYWYEQYKNGMSQHMLELNFAARRTVLETADKQGMRINTQGDLSAAAERVMSDMLPK